MTVSRLLSLPLLALAPLMLVACGDDAATDGTARSEPLPMVAAPEGTSWTDKVAATPEGGYLVGNPDAPLKLVEYGSLTCPACARFAEEGVDPLMEKYVATGRVSFEFRSFLIHGPLDLVLTRFIGCSSPEAALPLADQIWANLGPLQDRAYANQAALSAANDLPENQRFVRFAEVAGLYEFFAARGISEDQARTCLADFASLERLAKLSEGYAGDGINQTPTFLLNGRKLDGGAWSQVEPLLQRAGAR
ncbi:thioredoxin domain-containing protein [Erythrobacter donghaensis]|uniref:thioredoxin domain-containing protein n=1 Tax=Erythrobacter donghaensis TaxID=267135 RepID=UPI000A362457|nr:thioredoxin domain-containing protein [Erythrobacter donghaensis]